MIRIVTYLKKLNIQLSMHILERFLSRNFKTFGRYEFDNCFNVTCFNEQQNIQVKTIYCMMGQIKQEILI